MSLMRQESLRVTQVTESVSCAPCDKCRMVCHMPPDVLSSPQAAALLGCSARTVHRLVSDGLLKPYMLGPGGAHGSFMFRRADVERLAKRRGTVTDAVAS